MKQILKINATRKRFIKAQIKKDDEQEVHWADVLKACKIEVDPTTAARALQDAGFDVKWHPPRKKPLREPEVEAERMEVCGRWRRCPVSYFTEKIHLMMDNEHWDTPTYRRARRHKSAKRIRGHLRTRAEGVQQGFTPLLRCFLG
jgi:hypothetical protein